MHLRPFWSLSALQSTLRTPTRYNPWLIWPLGLAVILSTVPGSALAFETHLAESRPTALVAPVTLNREHQTVQAVVARPHPVTKAGIRPKPTRVATTASVVAPVTGISSEERKETVVTLEGEASYYSRAGCLGCDPAMIMANGQPLDDSRLTMAIGAHLKHLVGRKAQVTSLTTGKSATVLITDTGGFYQAKYGSRVADLTIASKQAIGMTGGVGQVRVEVF